MARLPRVLLPTLVEWRHRLALRRPARPPFRPARPVTRGRHGRTSLTDHVDYTSFCALAAAEPEVFATFKREPVYREVLEHVTCEQGAAYLERVLEQSPAFVPLFDRFRENDRLGSPRTCAYGDYGRFSPTTLRYTKVLSDLLLLFGPLDGLRIVEIGCGYGGQCYAFSELTRDVQDRYLERVLRRTPRGYVTCNWISPAEFRAYTRDELLAAIPGSRFVAEVPQTAAENAVLVWGDRGGG